MTRRPTPTGPIRLLPLALAALLLLTAACGGGGDDEGDAADGGAGAAAVRKAVTVEGDPGTAPEVTIDAPLKLSESSSWVTVEGDGDEVAPTSTAILQLSLFNGETGKPAISTYDEGQSPQAVDLTQQVFPSLVRGLTGAQAGSRVVIASTAEEAYGAAGSPQVGLGEGEPVVIVADVLSTDPTEVLDAPDGTERKPQAVAPTLVESGGVPTGFDYPTKKAPRKAARYVLVEGDGPAIEDPSRVTLNYLGQVWGADSTFDGSYERGEPATFSIGLGQVIPAWDQLLEGVKEGSRVILVCPPDLAYGKAGQGEDIPPSSTLVFVVDVLGVG